MDGSVAAFPAMVDPVIVRREEVLLKMAPPLPPEAVPPVAVFPEKVLFAMVAVPVLYKPPPDPGPAALPAWLFDMVHWLMLRVPLLKMPPPCPLPVSALPEITQELRLRMPLLAIPPPPLPVSWPFWIVTAETDTVIPGPTFNTGTAPPPSIARLDAPGPVTIMLAVRVGRALTKWIAPVTVNVMEPPPEALALVIAARNELAPESARL